MKSVEQLGRLLGTVVVLAVALALPRSGPAYVKPGDTINKANADQVKELVSPGVLWCVKRGWPMKIVEYKKIEPPKPYQDATEKYSGQVKLAADGLNIEGYVAGMPFPKIDPNDPKVATKIMWNYEYKWLITDDADSRNFDADTGPIFGGETPMSIERHYLVDHVRALRYIGRLHIEPKPIWETKEGFQSKSTLHPIVEPFDLKGVGGLTNRYIDPAKPDDTFLYMPSLRRVRRLSTPPRSDALFWQDNELDSYYGYAGHIAWMNWKFLGEKEVLAAFHGKNYPVKWNDKVDWAFDDVWEKRKMYVV